jgi:hypothetical protein
MWPFTKPKHLRVRNFIVKLINANCPELQGVVDDRRFDSRVNVAIVIAIIPLVDGRPQLARGTSAVTKDFSNTGVSVVLEHLMDLHQVILGFRFEGEITFIRAETKHRDPMGGGFFQIGFHLTEIVEPSEFPELASVNF